MAGKFGIVVNVPTEPSQLFAGDYKTLKNVAIKAGEGVAIPRGAILCLNKSDGKYHVLDLEADVGAEVLMAGDGAKKTMSVLAAAGHLVPGTVKVKSTVGAAAKTITDDGFGRFFDAQHKGFVDYESGKILMDFTTAPDNATNVTTDYTKGGVTTRASAVLASAEVVDATADIIVPAVFQGPVRSEDLIWPADITSAQKTRTVQALQEAGVIVVE